MVDKNKNDWSSKLSDALWVYRTAHKTPIGMTPYQLVYEKTCHLSFELENIYFWVIKEVNLNQDPKGHQRRRKIHELEDLRLCAYHNAYIYKERMKHWFNKR